MKSNNTRNKQQIPTRDRHDLLPIHDGVYHVNIYSNGETELGRLLSHFAPLGIEHPEYGSFASLEAFWYWLATGQQHDQLRPLYGFMAKQKGKRYPKVDIPNFIQQIRFANRLKVQQHPRLQTMLIENTLPFEHYYYYGQKDNCRVVDRYDSFVEIIMELEDITHCLRSNLPL